MRKCENNNPKYLGLRSGRLVVIGFREASEKSYHGIVWDCQCDCGNIVYGKRPKEIKSGALRSCGCLKKEQDRINLLESRPGHRLSNTRQYRIWEKMKARCENPTNPAYPRYGGRGINICDEWQDFKAFYDWSLENGYADDLTIERIDVDKGYSPDNCRWATMLEQARNKRNTVRVMLDGEEVPLKVACERLGLPYKAVHLRMTRYGMSYDEAISTPFADKSKSLKRRCEEAGMDYHMVYYRIHKCGWPEDKALSIPKLPHGANKPF